MLEDAKLSSPGLALASATNSLTDFAGTDGYTAITLTVRSITETGEKSFTAS